MNRIDRIEVYNDGVDHEIHFILGEDGLWYHEDFRRGSWNDINPATRADVKEFLSENIRAVSDEITESLADNSLWTRIRETLHLQGHDVEDVEAWALACYNMGMDPMQHLRTVIPFCEVLYAYHWNWDFIPGCLYVVYERDKESVGLHVENEQPNDVDLPLIERPDELDAWEKSWKLWGDYQHEWSENKDFIMEAGQ